MGSLGTYKGVKVFEVRGQHAAIKESLENPSIITCYWITSTRAKMYRHGVPFGELVDTGDDVLRVELLEEKKKEEPKKVVPKEVPKEESIDNYFIEAKRNIDDILNELLAVEFVINSKLV